ncbi:MAG: LPS assembly lipoprotein LptE [Elusimicrobiota bacterium]|nr:LPS assembly lipoprotein LptE [Elusimicrobiota bacterium]
MKKVIPLLLLLLASACGTDVAYKPTPQILPQHVQRLALRPIQNKTQQFGLEDKLLLRVRDEFLRDGRYPLVPEPESQGIVWITISRYILTAVQYDSTQAATAYKLRILVDLQFVDKSTNHILWEEKNLEGILSFPAQTLRGGLTEEQAREQIWDILARNIVKRVVDGFGSVTGTSERRITGEAPSTQPSAKPEEPLKPVISNPY